MKLTKLSLITVLALTSAMAGDAKISGDAKLFYGTTDGGGADLFNKNGAMGDTAVSLDYTREVSDGVTLNVGVTGVSTLGLEGTLVSGTWVQHNRHDTIDSTGAKTVAGDVKDSAWIDTANIVLKPVEKTMLVIGRQALDTPLAFTETWNIAPNTFDAAVAVDTHIQDTTLIAAWVGRGNGHNGYENLHGGMTKYGALNGSQEHALADNKGAFAAAVINKSIPMTTAQLWFYNVRNEADAVWAQADIAPSKELSVGLQYSQISPKGVVDGADDTKAMAVKVGYTVSGVDLAAAYSEISDEGLVYMGNTATGGAHNGQSKLYTDAWWNLGYVGQAGATTVMVSASYDDTYTAQYTAVSNSNSNMLEMNEITVTATKKVGPVDATVALINTQSDDDAIDGNTIQAYLTVPFSL